MHKSLSLLALLPSTLAHFVLNYPPSLGFNEDDQGTAPCGGVDVAIPDNATEVTVGGFSVAVRSTHPQSNWLYRITTSVEEPYNWTNILPVVSQSGVGDFCLPNITVPEDLIGQKAILQISASAVDGALYQVSEMHERGSKDFETYAT